MSLLTARTTLAHGVGIAVPDQVITSPDSEWREVVRTAMQIEA